MFNKEGNGCDSAKVGELATVGKTDSEDFLGAERALSLEGTQDSKVLLSRNRMNWKPGKNWTKYGPKWTPFKKQLNSLPKSKFLTNKSSSG